jgi:hypothetical protein
MKTVCIECRKYDEWDERVRKKILERQWDINIDHSWWDFVYDDVTTIGELMGIDISKIYFSGFSSQGDGACFESSYSYKKGGVKKVKEYVPLDTTLHNIAERLQIVQKPHFYKLSASVKQSGHYMHEYCTEILVYKDGNYLYSDAEQKAEEELIGILRDYMRWIYRSLNSEYEGLTSEEAIIDTLRTNEYEFNERGKIM